jgi:hemerythrin
MPDSHEMIRQHRELIALCHKLDEAVRKRLPRPEIYEIIDELVTRTVRHFAAEERLMAEVGYPEMAQHTAKHRDLVESTRKCRKQLDLYGEEHFTEWFNHWPFPAILAHIENGDHQIADHLRHEEK